MSRTREFLGAGQFDRRIEIEFKVVTQDPTYGTELVTWELLATEWANVQDALPSRSESVLQGLAVAKNQSRIRMRWREDIDSSMRIVDLSTEAVYQIIGGPAMLGRRQFLEVQCERYDSLRVPQAWLWADGSEIEWEDGSSMVQE